MSFSVTPTTFQVLHIRCLVATVLDSADVDETLPSSQKVLLHRADK